MLEQPKVELDLDGWTDISSYVKYENRISITRGRSSEGSRGLEQSTCSMTLLNHDGRFSPRNPSSPYYGVLGRNTPIRVSLAAPDSYLDLTAAQARAITTFIPGSVDIAANMDVRVDLWSDQWQSGTLCGRWFNGLDNAGEASWGLLVLEPGMLCLQWSEDGTDDTRKFVVATEPLPITHGRMAVRAVIDVNITGSSHSVWFYTADTIDGPWTLLGDEVPVSGTTSIYNNAEPICVGYLPYMDHEPVMEGDVPVAMGDVAEQVPGHYYAFELRTGTGSDVDTTVLASPSWTGRSGTIEDPDDDAITDGQNNVWRSSLTNGRTTDRLWRFWGEVSEWPPKSDISGTDVTVSITASGPTRRIVQGGQALRSAMHQMYTGTSGYVPHGDDNPDAYKGIIAYWPMEDGKEATQLEGVGDLVQPGVVTGTPSLASYSNWTASDALPQMDTGTFAFRTPPYDPDEFVFLLGADSYASIHMFVFAATPAVAAETSLLRVLLAGGVAEVDVRLTTGGDLRVRAYDTDHNSVEDTTVDANVYSRGFFILELNIIDEGLGDVLWELNVLDFVNTDLMTDEPDGVSDGDSFTGSYSRVTRIIVGSDQGLGTTYVGHLSVSNNPNVLATATPLPPEVAAFNGEKPLRRISRLVTAQGLSTTPVSYHDSDDPVSMGDQLARSWSDLLAEAAESDQGILYEMKDRPGVGYRSRLSLYNQTPALTLDHSAHELSQSLAPTDDDQYLVNEIAVTREAGSTFHAEVNDGPLGTDTVGRAPGTQTLSLSSDAQLADQAGWRLHLGTVDEARQPTVQVNLAHSSFTSDKRLEALRTDIGGRILITDPPDWLPPDDISQLVQGYSEVIDQFQHIITFNCAPESPYHVGQVEVDGHDRIDTGGSTLASAATSTATSLSVASTGELWTTDGSDVPFDIMVAGERMTVTTVGEVINANPYFATGITGWNGVFATVAHETTIVQPGYAGSMKVTPSGTDAFVFGGSDFTGAGTITAAKDYLAEMFVYSPGGGTHFGITVNWHDSAATFLSASNLLDQTVPAATWTYLSFAVTAPASASQATIYANLGGTPAASSVFYMSAVKLIPANDASPQTFTVTRSVNGVVKAQASGAEVTVAEPAYVAL